MEIATLLKKLRNNHIDISLQDNNLVIHSDQPEIPSELLSELKSNKAAIILYLQNSIAGSSQHAAIQNTALQPSYALSSAQKRLWVLSQFDDANLAYNMCDFYEFSGALNEAALEQAFSTLIERHEILRTVFKENENGEVRQFIMPASELNFKMTSEDLRSEKNASELSQRLVQNEIETPFHLSSGPLIRVRLLRVADTRYVLSYVMHHIISDGWSMGVLMKELLALYDAYSHAKEAPLQPLRIQYKDYAAWQLDQLSGENLKAHKDYWLTQFEGALPVLELNGSHPRPALKSYKGGSVNRVFNAPLSRGIRQLCHNSGATLFMGLVAGINALLYRYTGQCDIITGSPIAGRLHTDLEGQIGFYVNTLALRTRFDGNDGFTSLLDRVKEITLNAYEHQVYPFDELVDMLNLKRDMSRSALFDVMIVLQNTDATGASQSSKGMEQVAVNRYAGAKQVISKFDLTFNIEEAGEELILSVEYNGDLYSPAFAQQLADHLAQLLEAAIAAPDMPVKQLDYLSTAEKTQLINTFNTTATTLSKNKTVSHLFEEQAQKTPGKTALVFEDSVYTYQELNSLCNRFAHYLQTQGAKPGDCIGVCIERSAWSAVSMIGILKLGAVYVPIDKALPASRIAYIIKESGTTLLISDDVEVFAAQEGIPHNLKIVSPTADLSGMRADDLSVAIDEEASSYIIYTSGSTGVPKGVEQTQLMLHNLINWDMHKAGFAWGQKHLQFSSYSFDSSLHDIYYALATGGELHVLNEITRKDLWQLRDYIVSKQIETVSMPYAALKVMFNELDADAFKGHKISEIISTGEQLYINGGLRQFLEKNPELKLFNLYGPSETHVVTGCHYSFASGEVPVKATIGLPVDNTELYILDASQQLVPVGVPGEIYIGGKNLAKGYNNRQDLTSEKFISHPFKNGERVYRSGDIGKWLANGEIEYLHRKDNQVKINGYRIETEEIEMALLSHAGVKEAVVVVISDASGENSLMACLTGSEPLNTSSLRAHLKSCLPAYMIPAQFVQLDTLPLTGNGKVDKKSLQHLENQNLATAAEYVAPRNETEEGLVKIWEHVLDRQTIGVKDDFFDLGGHSLKATRVLSLIKKEYGVQLNIREIFIHPTVEGIAGLMDTHLWIKEQETAESENSNTESLIF